MSKRTKAVVQAELDDAIKWRNHWKTLAEDLNYTLSWAVDDRSTAQRAHNKKVAKLEKKIAKLKKAGRK